MCALMVMMVEGGGRDVGELMMMEVEMMPKTPLMMVQLLLCYFNFIFKIV